MNADRKAVCDAVVAGLNAKLRAKIQAFADEKGISYEEAASRAALVIDGKRIEPIHASFIAVERAPDEDLE
ncbi:MAG: hypothetical protein ACREGB_01755 [Candidatus Saccharimonadales bacterium]